MKTRKKKSETGKTPCGARHSDAKRTNSAFRIPNSAFAL